MRVMVAVLAAVVAVAAVIGLAVMVGHVHGVDSAPPPPEVGGEVRCIVQKPIVASGTPGDDDMQRVARRIRRFCDAMNGTPANTPPGVVNAREFCLDMQRRGQLLAADDCNRVPADQTYRP